MTSTFDHNKQHLYAQLAVWTREKNWAAIDEIFLKTDPSLSQPDIVMLRAELAAFHGYPANNSWQELLKQAVHENYKPALIVAALYHQWSGHDELVADIQHHVNHNASIPSTLFDQLFPSQWDHYTPPQWKSLHSDNDVAVEVSGAFSSTLLSSLICQILAPQLRPASVIDPTSGKAVAHPVRRNSFAQWLPEQLGWIGKLIETRLAETAEFQISRGEVFSLLHYSPGQEYRQHLDALPKAKLQTEANQGGQRVKTILLALNDDYVGGHTDFPRLALSVRLQAGQLLRFNNIDAKGKPAKNSVHVGSTVTNGQKWLLSKWVRENQTPYGQEVGLD